MFDRSWEDIISGFAPAFFLISVMMAGRGAGQLGLHPRLEIMALLFH